MARYEGHSLPGRSSTSGNKPAGGLLSSLTSTLVSRKQARTKDKAVQAPPFRGTTAGQKALISSATGKFAPSEFVENMKRLNAAIKRGETTFTKKNGEIQDIGKITPQQKYMAAHWANQSEVKAPGGMQKMRQAFIIDARLEKQKLQSGLNIDTAYNAAAKLEKLTAPKPVVDEKALRHEALANLHARLTPANHPAVATSAVRPSATPMAFVEPVPLPVSSGTGHSPALRYTAPSGGQTPANFSAPSTNGRFSPSSAEPAPIAPPITAATENNLAQSTPVTQTEVSAAPTRPEPEPFVQPLPPHPLVPSASSDLSDTLGGSEDGE